MRTDGFKLDYGAEGLEDLSARGSASQSSTSRWSQPDDASRALRETPGAFAFHTDTEEGPWWRVDFEAAVLLRYVVVMNRHRPYHRPDQRIAVETSADGVAWTEIATALCTFGSDAAGLPLMLDLGALVPVRALRVTLAERGALHLKRVLPVGRPRDPQDAPIFTVTRSDGLCQRLLALTNAILLARREGARFSFLWEDKTYDPKERHAVDDVAGLFSRDFAERHRETVQTAAALQAAPTYSDRPHDAAALARILAKGAEVGRVRVHQAIDLRVNFPSLRELISDADYADAFTQIGFSKGVRRAQKAAGEVALGHEDACVHVRGGDILHGRHAFHGNFVHKALSCYEIDRIATGSRTGGRVVLIGQERELVAAFARSNQHVVDGATLSPPVGMTAVEAVLFDVALMARVRTIHAADSAVAQLASRIGPARLHETGGLAGMEGYTLEMARNYVAQGLLGVQVAFSALKAALFHMGAGRAEEALCWIEMAQELRPGNVYHAVLEAALRLDLGDVEGAERAAERGLEVERPDEIGNTVSEVINGRNNRREQLPARLRAAFKAEDPLPCALEEMRRRWRPDGI